MRKVLGCILLAAVLVVCLGMRGVIPVDIEDMPNDDVVTLYTEDGRCEQFTASEAEAQKTVGWFEDFNDVITTMWTDDGTSVIVFKADVSKYQEEGYTTNYSSIFVKIYNPSTDEEKEVLKSDVKEYIDNGWKRGTNGVDPEQPMVCLTFDDGPNPATTDKLLEALEENNARATFFIVGSRVSSVSGAANSIKKMKEIGCEVSSHTYSHTTLTSLSTDAVKEEFQKTDNEFENVIEDGASTIRPPYGSYNDTIKEIAREYGQPIILWSVDTEDWLTKNADSTYNHVMANVSDGAIILFHDIYEPSVEAAIRLIPALQEAGYQLVTVSEMGEAKIGGLKPGEVYTDLYSNTVKKINGEN